VIDLTRQANQGRSDRGRDLVRQQVFPVLGSPLTKSGRSSAIAALTAVFSSSPAT
jgi:hypothetical protein